MKSVVRYARHSLDIDEVRAHLTSGKMPTRLALSWNERVAFTLTEADVVRYAGLTGEWEARSTDEEAARQARAKVLFDSRRIPGEIFDVLEHPDQPLLTMGVPPPMRKNSLSHGMVSVSAV